MAQISTQPTRLVDLVEVSAHDEQIDLAVQFNCSMRYVTHLPASEGSDLRVHGPDRLAAVAAELNDRPRKTLGWNTPAALLATVLTQHTAS